MALLSLVCKTVQEIQAIISCLSQSTSCLIHDILECFYCLASVYYYLESQHRIGSGYVWYIKSCLFMCSAPWNLYWVDCTFMLVVPVGLGTGLWGWFWSPGVNILRKGFLVKRFSSQSFARLWIQFKFVLLHACLKSIRDWVVLVIRQHIHTWGAA